MTDPHAALHEVLGAAAASAAPTNVLALDASAAQVDDLAQTMRVLLSAVHGSEAEVAVLAPYADELALWGAGPHLPVGGASGALRHSVLLGAPDREHWRILVVHDLEALETGVSRALLEVLGRELCDIQRYGQSHRVTTKLVVIAQIARAAIGRVSAHLLDRFELRLPGPWKTDDADRRVNLRQWLESGVESGPGAALAPDLMDRVHAARERAGIPALAPDALTLALDLAGARSIGHRRALGLARLGAALARLDGDPTVGPAHLTRIAQVAGLAGSKVHQSGAGTGSPIAPEETAAVQSEGAASAQTESQDAPRGKSRPDSAWDRAGDDTSGAVADSATANSSLPGGAPAGTTIRAQVAAAARLEPALAPASAAFPEDDELEDRADCQLQLPFGMRRSPRNERGPIIGVRRFRPGSTLAAVPTLIAALPFQFQRRKNLRRDAGDRRLILHPMDLRAWRRATLASHLLTIVLDFTALEHCAWGKALAPYVARAYVDRAPVCLVLVGAAATPNELKAQRVLSRNVLTPAFRQGLNGRSGRASPLAHGLRLAHETVAESLHRKRDTGRRVRLVVLSDGRGNVPLDASLRGKIDTAVARRGIEDTLHEARRIAALSGVDTVLLHPQPPLGQAITRDFALAIGGRVEAIAVNPLDAAS